MKLKSTEANSTKLSTPELETLIVCSVRYALGRKSYIVSDVCSLTKKFWEAIPKSTKLVIRKAISEAIDFAAKKSSLVGMKCDHDNWVELLEWTTEKDH